MDDKKRKDDIKNVAVASAQFETVQRHGSAIKQHFVAYTGVDNEAGKTLHNGLKQISKFKVNPNDEFKNIHQQAGYSAEVKSVARENAKNIINGDKTRVIRTDDMGRVNDPLVDTFKLDENGNIIDGSGAQLKFLGASEKDPEHIKDAERAFEKLNSKKFDKYFENDVKIEVPSDQYDKLIDEANSQIDKLSKQLDKQKELGNTEKIEAIKQKIAKVKKIKKSLRKSSVSSSEAIEARKNPELSTAKDVARLSHDAGVTAAKSAAVIGGSVSIIKNIVAVYKGEIEGDEAIVNVAKDTATTAVVGYATGFSGSAIKGAMQNAKSTSLKALSKTNLPATLVSLTVSTGKTLNRYFNGEIDGVQCLQDLGESGTGMLSSAMFSAIGQVVIPIPVVGAMIGGMVGYALSSVSYGILMQSLNEAKMAREERRRVEEACEEHIRMIRQYRFEIENLINEYLSESVSIFRGSFNAVKESLDIGDVDGFIKGTNKIVEGFGGSPLFSDMEDFELKMESDTTFVL